MVEDLIVISDRYLETKAEGRGQKAEGNSQEKKMGIAFGTTTSTDPTTIASIA
jgi:hypothetical protein